MPNIPDTGGASLVERAVRGSLNQDTTERLRACKKAIVAVENGETKITNLLYNAILLVLKSVEAQEGDYESIEQSLSLLARVKPYSPRSVKNQAKNKRLPQPEDAWSGGEGEESENSFRSSDVSHRVKPLIRDFPEPVDRTKFRDNGRVDWLLDAPLGLDEQIRLLQIQKSYGVVRNDEWLLKKDANVPELISLALGGRENNIENLSKLLFHIKESWTHGGIVLTNSPLCTAVIKTLKDAGVLPSDHPLWLSMFSSSLFDAAFAAQERK
jgi:hypothetical protein